MEDLSYVKATGRRPGASLLEAVLILLVVCVFGLAGCDKEKDLLEKSRFETRDNGTSFVREASMPMGTGALPGAEPSPAISLSGAGRLIACAAISGLFIFVILFFRNKRAHPEARTIEVFVLLLLLSGFSLVTENAYRAGVTSNIAWLVGAAGASLYAIKLIRRSVESVDLKRAGKDPAKILVLVSMAFLFVCVYALKAGRVSDAENAARLAYGLMLAGAGVITVRKLLALRTKDPLKKPAAVIKTQSAPLKHPSKMRADEHTGLGQKEA